MDAENPSGEPKKWHNWAIWTSAVAFALFWSIDGFFFWTFLLMTVYFIFLKVYHTGINFPGTGQSFTGNKGFGQRPATAPIQGAQVVRLVAIIFGLLTFLFVVIAMFTGSDDEPVAAQEEPQVVDETQSTALNDKGNEFYGQQNYDSALYYYEEALRLDPYNQYAQYNKALIFFTRQDYRSSIQLVKSCLEDHPDYQQAYWLMGDNYASINLNDSAAYYLEKGYDTQYREAGFLELMGDVYQKLGQRDKAINKYRESLQQNADQNGVLQKLMTLDPDAAKEFSSR